MVHMVILFEIKCVLMCIIESWIYMCQLHNKEHLWKEKGKLLSWTNLSIKMIRLCTLELSKFIEVSKYHSIIKEQHIVRHACSRSPEILSLFFKLKRIVGINRLAKSERGCWQVYQSNSWARIFLYYDIIIGYQEITTHLLNYDCVLA